MTADYGRDLRFALLFTQARHWGHLTHYVSQYHAQVPHIVRSNCERLALFRVSARSAQFWSEDFAQDAIRENAARLPRYHFVLTSRYGEPRVCVIQLAQRVSLK